MTHYETLISEALGVTDMAVVRAVEGIMRNVIFHSTLDWQSHAMLVKAAREAHDVYKASFDPVLCAELGIEPGMF